MREKNIIDYYADLSAKFSKNGESSQEHYASLKLAYSSLKEQSQKLTLTQNQRISYGLTRLPGTYAAVSKVLSALQQRLPRFSPNRILDIGSGPGTAIFAALEKFGHVREVCALEKDSAFVAMAQEAYRELYGTIPETLVWHQDLAPSDKICGQFDLTILSYVLSETPAQNLPKLVQWAASHTCGVLLIVDAGTKASFAQINLAREQLINSGELNLLAPCFHDLACPMAKNDFCHFPVRFTRSRLLQKAKGGTLGYEDEKFSYLLFVKDQSLQPMETNSGRIIARPMKRTGHYIFDVCQNNGQLERVIISKKDRERFKDAGQKKWGDEI